MKYSSPTHVLGLLLATSAALAEDFDARAWSGPNVAATPPRAVGVGPRASASGGGGGGKMHDMLVRHAYSSENGEEMLELMHPLIHYVPGFMQWTFEYGREWESLAEAVHAFKVGDGKMRTAGCE